MSQWVKIKGAHDLAVCACLPGLSLALHFGPLELIMAPPSLGLRLIRFTRHHPLDPSEPPASIDRSHQPDYDPPILPPRLEGDGFDPLWTWLGSFGPSFQSQNIIPTSTPAPAPSASSVKQSRATAAVRYRSYCNLCNATTAPKGNNLRTNNPIDGFVLIALSLLYTHV